MMNENHKVSLITNYPADKPTDNFVGREGLIKDIKDMIDSENKTVLVSGFGGMGKTEICKKIFHEYYNSPQNDIKYIGWINYGTNLKSSIFQNIIYFKKFEEMNYIYEVSHKSIEEVHFDLTREFLNEHGGQVLLFIDNMNEAEKEDRDIILNLPNKIVITSRINEFDRVKPIEIDKLPLADCK
ncbi:MAG: ATP-binding protein, partial [Clostridiales bacterium]|nr:ATP-binding protein [Clostridiales bacterium]